MKRASLYVRLSTQQRASNLSVDGMLAECRALAAREGYAVHREYVDIGESGNKRDRAGFLAWMRDGQGGVVDALIAHAVDRSSRAGIGHLAQLLDVSEGVDRDGKPLGHRARVLTVREGIDSDRQDSKWRLSFVLNAELAREEREVIVARNTARSARMRQARRWAGKRPYGFDIVRDESGGTTLRIRADEAVVLERIAVYVEEGRTCRAIASILNSEGVPSLRGAPDWGKSEPARLLRRPSTAGLLAHNGQPLRDDDGELIRPFPGILDVERWYRLLEILTSPSTPTRTPGRPPMLLTGISKCAGCEHGLVRHAGSRRVPFYRCMYDKCTAHGSIPAELFETHVVDRVLEVFGEVRLSRTVRVSSRPVEQASIDARRAPLVERIGKDAGDVEAIEELRSLQEEERQLHEGKEQSFDRVELDTVPFAERWDETVEVSERRDLLRRAIECVWVEKRRGRKESYESFVEIEFTEEAEQQRDEQLAREWDRHGGFE